MRAYHFSNPTVSMSVALAVGKRLQIGIIYVPVMDKMYTARKGKGAELNGKKISVIIFIVIIDSKV